MIMSENSPPRSGSPRLSPNDGLVTDIYQLTMVQSYLKQGMKQEAVFEFFVRNLPASRKFLVAAGLSQTIDYLFNLHFNSDELSWLQEQGLRDPNLLDFLQHFQFEGDIDAIPEGTVCFANEPILRVTAPLPVAQLVESRIINLLHFQTLIASKAARIRLAAKDRILIDFGLRRAHGWEAGLLAARAAYIGGFNGTATVSAGYQFGLNLYGTMGHSYILAYQNETRAFVDFSRTHPDKTILLVDTYDPIKGTENAIAAAKKLQQEGIAIRGIRLDSGDLDNLSRTIRGMLDHAGMHNTAIFVSGNLDEYSIATMIGHHAPIGGFGVGTRLGVSADSPYLDCAYKLQSYAGRPVRKKSPGKTTLPGAKQVFRRYNRRGLLIEDVIAPAATPRDGHALLIPIIREGRLVGPLPTLNASREQFLDDLDRLPASLKQLEKTQNHFSARIDPALTRLVELTDHPAPSDD